MIIGVLKEIKCGESRVIVTPVEAEELINDGHEVLVQKNAGYIAGFNDEEYARIGAKIIDNREDNLITREMLSLMKRGSVIVDISADVGGAIETYRPTTHEDPVYEVDGIIHYGVDNIPGAAAHTTSIAYAASVLPHIRAIANKGVREACRKDGFLRRSLTAYNGILTHKETSIIQNRKWSTPEEILELDLDNIDLAPIATTI